jgi:uncharacterized phage protein (TIGR02218 family)
VKTASPELIAFLNSARAGVKPDLYSFTLRSTPTDPVNIVPVVQTNSSGSYFIVETDPPVTPATSDVFELLITVEKPLEAGVIAEVDGLNTGDPRQLRMPNGVDQIPDGLWSVGDTIRFRYDGAHFRYVEPDAGPIVLRWTDADVPITLDAPLVAAPTTWFAGPKIGRSGVKSSLGVEVSTLSVTFYPEPTDLVGEVPLIPFIRGGGLDGASLRLERAFGFTHDDLVGTLVMFAGRVTNVTDITPTEVTIEVSSWLELLNVNMPRNLVQPPCLNTLYDAACGLARTDWAVDGAAEAASTTTLIQTDLGEAAGVFDRGTIKFTSGANAGQIRTIRSQASGGAVTLVLPLPAAPEAGDTFTAYPGCDRTLATCTAKFDNRLNFRGMPFVPTPETAV